MKRDGFLFVVIAFAIISAFVLYLDFSKECGSLVCVAEYVSTGEASPKVYDLGDSFISELIYPFVNPVDGVLLQPSPGPSGLTVTPLSLTSLKLDWQDNSLDEDGYVVERSDSVSGPFSQIATLGIDSTSYTDEGLNPQTVYYYQVYAFNVDGNVYSEIASGETLGPVINSLSPNLVYNDVPNSVSILGSNLPNNFIIMFKSSTETNYQVYCTFSSSCAWISPSEITFPVPVGSIPNIYDFKVVDFDTLAESGAVQLDVRAPPVISSIDNPVVSHNVQNSITLTGTGFSPNFALFFTDPVNPSNPPVAYCTFDNPNPFGHNCQRLSDTSFTFVIPQGELPGNYGLVYFNFEGLRYSDPVSFTINPTTCLDGVQTQSCSSQSGAGILNVGVCSASVAECVGGVFETCNGAFHLSNTPSYEITETTCNDNEDNDCNNEGDYTGTPGNSHGDINCPVSISNINAPSSVIAGSQFNLGCTSNVGNIISVQGNLDSVSCGSPTWNANIASFTCTSSTSPGITQTAQCSVDLTRSYQTGGNPTASVQLIASTCSGYTSSGSVVCQDNGCEWVTACSVTNPQQSSGGPDRCVDVGTVNYQCLANQCSAASPDSCTSSQSYNSVSCGCQEQTPSISDINGQTGTLDLDWGSNNNVVISGQYFAQNAQVLIDGQVISNPVVIDLTGTSVSFTINAEQFSVGQHILNVLNPVSTSSSSDFAIRFISNPQITSIDPPIVLNNVNTPISIYGSDFDPSYRVLINGVDLTFLSTRVNSGLIQFLVPSTSIVGFIQVIIVNGDGSASSLPASFKINYPFDYVINVNPSAATVSTGYSFNADVTFTNYFDMTQEEIIVTVANIPEATVSFVGPDRCTPSGIVPNPSCTVTLQVDVGSVIEQNYTLNINAVSSLTNVVHQTTLTLNGIIVNPSLCNNGILDASNGETDIDCGGPTCNSCNFGQTCSLNNDCQANPTCSPPIGLCYTPSGTSDPTAICAPDQDCDSVPDGVDICSSTPVGTIVSSLNGCPVPIATEFTSSSTTNFFSVLDLNAVPNMILRVNGIGGIQYSNPVSVLTLIAGIYQALNLNDAVDIANNLIVVDSVNYPGLAGPAVITIEGLTYSDVTPITRASSSGTFAVCSASQCDDLTYAGGIFTMAVTGFSEYSTQQASCGDAYCSLSETCSSCTVDCGACPSSGTPSSSGGSSGGSGGSSRGGSGGAPRVVYQCDDNLDNDGDGLFDFPADPGCFTLQDNSELNENPLIGTPGNDDGIIAPLEKIFEIRLVFWIVLITLIGGIVAVSTTIIRDLMGKKKFNQLVKTVNPSQTQGTRPQVGI